MKRNSSSNPYHYFVRPGFGITFFGIRGRAARQHRDTVMTRYSIVAIVLHWLIAVAIFILLGLGFYMTGLPDSAAAEKLKLYQLHKSIGITVLVLSLCRLG